MNKQKDIRKKIPFLTQASLLLLILNSFFLHAIKNNQIWPFIILIIGIGILFLAHKSREKNISNLNQWTKSSFFSFVIFLVLGNYFLISLIGETTQEKILFKIISGSWMIIASLVFLFLGIKSKKYEKER